MRSFDAPLVDIDFNVDKVTHIFTNLKEASAPGSDSVHPKVLRECNEVLSTPIFSIIRKSLDEGMLPDAWKEAYVTPIYKGGKKSDPLNYRPISLTSVPCKIAERIIKDAIMEHLEKNDLLSQHQHGFRSRRSCLTQLLEYFTEVHDCLDDGDPVDAIYLDCKKAFDTVPHKRLIAKLEAYGISGKVLNWIKSFLSGRSQRVVVKGVLSDSLPVWSGVPQGSVLGPVLFLIYINDLLDDIQSSGKLFADDSKIFRKILSIRDKNILQRDLVKLQEWSSKWLLEFNAKKCEIMHFGRKNQKYDYTLNDAVLTKKDEVKDLGIIVTPNLKPSTHVARIAAKANSMLGRVKRAFTYMDNQMFNNLYPSLIRSQMEFAVQVWSPQLKKDIVKLEKVQRRATKMVHKLADKPYEERLKSLKLTTLEVRRLRGDLIEVYKIMNNLEDIDRSRFFTLRSETHSHETRGHKLRIQPVDKHTKTRKKHFDIRVIRIWNSLPERVVYSSSVDSFKNQLDAYYNRRGTYEP